MSPHLAALLLLLLTSLAGVSSALELNEFRWSFDAESNSSSLTICSLVPFLEQGEVSGVTLVVEVLGTTTEHNFLGELVDDSCAAFNMIHLAQMPSTDTVYNLLISALVDGEQEFVMSETIFAMEVETATLSCSGKPLTRAIAPISTKFEECLSDPSLFGNVCYTEGDLTCFILYDSDPPGLKVCLEGSSLTAPVTDDGIQSINYQAYSFSNLCPLASDGLLSINFLAYSSSSLSNTTVGLDVTGAGPNAEAVFWKDGGVQSVSIFSEGPWNATSFAPHFAEYTVCVVDTDQDNQPVTSSAAILTDLGVRVADSVNRDDEDALLQLSFTNANPESTYRMSVGPSFPSLEVPLEADPLDCSDVEHNTTCYRFMEYAGADKDVFVALEYADQAGSAVGNMVIVSYNIRLLINSTGEEEGWDEM